MCNDTYPSSRHTEYLHCPKNPPCSLCSSPTHPLILSLSPQFCLFQNVTDLASYSIWPFQIGFFHLVRCIHVFSMSFHGSIAHFFLVLNNIPLSGSTSLFIHSRTERYLGCLQVLEILNKGLFFSPSESWLLQHTPAPGTHTSQSSERN